MCSQFVKGSSKLLRFRGDYQRAQDQDTGKEKNDFMTENTTIHTRGNLIKDGSESWERPEKKHL